MVGYYFAYAVLVLVSSARTARAGQKKQALLQVRNLVLFGLMSMVAMLILLWPMVSRILAYSYAERYSYYNGGGFAAEISLQFWRMGLMNLVLVGMGLWFCLKKRKMPALPCLAGLEILLSMLLFTRIQNTGSHQMLLFLPGWFLLFLLGAAALAEGISRFRAAKVVFWVFTLVFATSVRCSPLTTIALPGFLVDHFPLKAASEFVRLDKLIYDFIVKHGGIPNFKGLYGFPGTACISLNDTIIHGIPSHDIVIRPGDIVSIDTGAKIDGFNGDNACTYAVGKVDLEAQRLLDVTKAALYKGIEQAVAGNRIGDIGYAVQSYCEDAGFSVVREFVGHGTGRELHEDPEVPNYGHQGRGPRLVPGMTIAIEPMICQYDCKITQSKDGWTVKTKDGGLAAHFEHSNAILKDHTEIMTRFWDDPDFDPATFSLK
mgnify:CR=1 FL=1